MGIGDLAQETGVKAVTIRYYEQIGVLPVEKRTLSNRRPSMPMIGRSRMNIGM